MITEQIVTDWFFRLPKGYAEPPYTELELSVLQEVLLENGINNWEVIIGKLKENDKPSASATEEPPKTFDDREDETHESNEDFRTLLDSIENFTEIIHRRYLPPGLTSIKGLEDLYVKIKELPDSLSTNLRRVLGKRTNRDITNGTFKMGQYEKMLYDLIMETVTIENSSPKLFWMACVLDGKIKPNAMGDSIETGNIIIDGVNVYIDNFRDEVITLAPLSPESLSLLSIIVNLGEVINDSKLETFNKDDVNSLLSQLTDEENKQELEQFLSMSTVSKLGRLRSLSSQIKTALENHNLAEIPLKFCTLIDQQIAKILSQISYWGSIKGDMVFLTKGSDLFPALNCTKEYKLGGGIFSLKDYKIHVLGNVIDEKLV